MKSRTALLFATLAAALIAVASGPHTSANYTVQPAALDGGGAHAASASYTHSGSILDIAGTGTAGIYTMGHGYIAQLTEAAPGCPEFTAWQTTHFESPANPNAAAGADPDRDGAENAAEFAFNMNPNAPDAGPLSPSGTAGLPRYATEEVDGRVRLTVEFIRRTTGCLAYSVESSSGDLDKWNPSEFTLIGAPVPLPGGFERVKLADAEPFGVQPRKFLRVLVKM